MMPRAPCLGGESQNKTNCLAQASLRLPVTSCLYLLSAEITSSCHHNQCTLCLPGAASKGLWIGHSLHPVLTLPVPPHGPFPPWVLSFSGITGFFCTNKTSSCLCSHTLQLPPDALKPMASFHPDSRSGPEAWLSSASFQVLSNHVFHQYIPFGFN